MVDCRLTFKDECKQGHQCNYGTKAIMPSLSLSFKEKRLSRMAENKTSSHPIAVSSVFFHPSRNNEQMKEIQSSPLDRNTSVPTTFGPNKQVIQ